MIKITKIQEKLNSISKIKSKFRIAVKLMTLKELGHRQTFDFGREILSHKIIPKSFIKVIEEKTIATLATGFSYAFDIEDEMMKIFMKN